MKSKSEVIRWMRLHKHEYIDECNELNYTGLAEAAAQQFNLYVNGSDIPEWVFEEAAKLEA